MAKSFTNPNTPATSSALTSEFIRVSFQDIDGWFGDIDNDDIAGAAAIASTKLAHGSGTLSAFLNLEHDTSTGAHKTSSNGCEGAYLAADSTNPHYKVVFEAVAISLENTSATLLRRTTVDQEASLSTGADGLDTAGAAIVEAANTQYSIVLLYDSTNLTDKLVFYEGSDLTSTVLDSTFYDTALPAYNARIGGATAYDYAKLAGTVLNNSAQHLETPRPIAGVGFSDVHAPIFAMHAVGIYTGNGADDRWIDVGFEPDFVMVKSAGTVGANFRTSSHASNVSTSFGGFADSADVIQEFGWNGADNWGFQIGTNAAVNANGVFFYWMALRNHSL